MTGFFPPGYGVPPLTRARECWAAGDVSGTVVALREHAGRRPNNFVGDILDTDPPKEMVERLLAVRVVGVDKFEVEIADQWTIC